MRFPFYIAKRYAFSKSRSKAIQVITRIAAMGIVVSAMAMFVVLSVFGGLRNFSLSFTHEIDPELKLFSATGKYFTVTDSQLQALADTTFFSGFSRIVEDRVLFLFKEKQTVAYLKGVDEAYATVSPMADHVLYGQWLAPDSDEVVVGLGISYRLSMGLFDTENAFESFAIKPGKGAIDNPQNAFVRKHLVPVGIYSLRNDELDDKYVYASLDVAQELLSLSAAQYTHIELALMPKTSEKMALAKIHEIFGDSVIVKNRIQLNDSLYRMLNTENIVVYLIVTLVVIIALFTIVGAMIMIILEKQANMKTLSNLGLSLKQIRRVFLMQGMIISGLGGVVGVLLGVVVVFLQQRFELLMIQVDLPYPVSFSFFNLGLVLFTVFILGFVASWIAASRVNSNYLD